MCVCVVTLLSNTSHLLTSPTAPPMAGLDILERAITLGIFNDQRGIGGSVDFLNEVIRARVGMDAKHYEMASLIRSFFTVD